MRAHLQFHAGEDISLAIEKCDADKIEAGGKLVGRFAGVTLVVDDIAGTYQHLRAKEIEFTAPPEKQVWGGTLAHFKDPDGNILSLMESGD